MHWKQVYHSKLCPYSTKSYVTSHQLNGNELCFSFLRPLFSCCSHTPTAHTYKAAACAVPRWFNSYPRCFAADVKQVLSDLHSLAAPLSLQKHISSFHEMTEYSCLFSALLFPTNTCNLWLVNAFLDTLCSPCSYFANTYLRD